MRKRKLTLSESKLVALQAFDRAVREYFKGPSPYWFYQGLEWTDEHVGPNGNPVLDVRILARRGRFQDPVQGAYLGFIALEKVSGHWEPRFARVGMLERAKDYQFESGPINNGQISEHFAFRDDSWWRHCFSCERVYMYPLVDASRNTDPERISEHDCPWCN